MAAERSGRPSAPASTEAASSDTKDPAHGSRVVGSSDAFPGKALAIADWTIRPNLVMAPLAGLTDPYFRAVIRRLGG